MSLLRRFLIRPAARVLSIWTGPRMLYGWRNADGSWCPHTRVSSHTCLEGGAGLVLGDHVFVGHFSRLDGSNGLVVEEGVQITSHVCVLSHSSHGAVRVMGRQYVRDPQPAGYVRRATHIGAYSFIGPHSVIAPGARLGRGVVVQAYSFVRGEVPDFAIVGPQVPGRPAEVLGDTREVDGPVLAQRPELQRLYAEWAGQGNLSHALAAAARPSSEAAR